MLFVESCTVLVKHKTPKGCRWWWHWPCPHSYFEEKIFSLYLSLRYKLINMAKLYTNFLKAKPEKILTMIPYYFSLINQEISVRSLLLSEDEIKALISLRNAQTWQGIQKRGFLPILKNTCFSIGAPWLHFFSFRVAYKREYKNRLDWKRPLSSSNQTTNLALFGPPLNHVSKHIYVTFEHFQCCSFHHFFGKPVPMLCATFSEDFAQYINLEMAQLEAISCNLISSGKRHQPPTLLQPSFSYS